MKKGIIFFTFIFIVFGRANAQEFDWMPLEKNIRQSKHLKQQLATVDSLILLAQQQVNDALFARAYINRLRIEDALFADTLYIKRLEPIDSILLEKKASPLLKAVFSLNKAQRLAYFEQTFFRTRYVNLMRPAAGAVDYAHLNQVALNDSIVQLLDQAIAYSRLIEPNKWEQLLWISSDLGLFLFKPNCTDLFIGEKLFLLNAFLYLDQKCSEEKLFDVKHRFLKDSIFSAAPQSSAQPIFLTYRYWQQINLEDSGKAALIDAMARQFFYERQYAQIKYDSAIEAVHR
ncbi:MAG: hypothetical protein RLY16_2302, partial [Bacteroidota bacterium]